MENMTIWNAVRRPPEDALKKINGGRLTGFTDISPQWRIQIMTEQFGPVGTGWQYEIVRAWTETMQNGEILVFVQIQVRYKLDGQWSEWIPGIGGSKIVKKESSGL